MTRLTNTCRKYLALAVLHDLYRADEVFVHLDGANGFCFCLKHRLHTLFDVHDIPCRLRKPRSLTQLTAFFSMTAR